MTARLDLFDRLVLGIFVYGRGGSDTMTKFVVLLDANHRAPVLYLYIRNQGTGRVAILQGIGLQEIYYYTVWVIQPCPTLTLLS
jgi:hypothetical protein